MKCAVCGTDRTGMNNDDVHRRELSIEDGRVTYCADVPECGEEAAREYLADLPEAERRVLAIEKRVLGIEAGLGQALDIIEAIAGTAKNGFEIASKSIIDIERRLNELENTDQGEPS